MELIFLMQVHKELWSAESNLKLIQIFLKKSSQENG